MIALEVLDLSEGDELLSLRFGLFVVKRRRLLGIDRGGSLLKTPRLSSPPLRRWKLLPLGDCQCQAMTSCSEQPTIVNSPWCRLLSDTGVIKREM